MFHEGFPLRFVYTVIYFWLVMYFGGGLLPREI